MVQISVKCFGKLWEIALDFINYFFETIRIDLLKQRAQHYVCIFSNASPLPDCFEFLNEAKVFMALTGGSNVSQKGIFLENKRRYCLLYLTIASPGELIIYLYRAEAGQRQVMALYWHSGLDGSLAENLIIDRQQYYIYGDHGFTIFRGFRLNSIKTLRLLNRYCPEPL